jgi:hypothetical protein
MYLPARVPTEGAHRLAWMIGTAPDPAATIVALEERIGINMVDRLLAGELTPGSTMGVHLALASRGKIVPRMFYRPTGLRWGEAPRGFAVPRSRGAMRASEMPLPEQRAH